MLRNAHLGEKIIKNYKDAITIVRIAVSSRGERRGCDWEGACVRLLGGVKIYFLIWVIVTMVFCSKNSH